MQEAGSGQTRPANHKGTPSCKESVMHVLAGQLQTQEERGNELGGED